MFNSDKKKPSLKFKKYKLNNIQLFEMYHKRIFLIAVTLLAFTLAIRAPHTSLHLETKTHSQATSPAVFTPASACLDGKVWSAKDLKCVCPSDRPYSDARGFCIACQAPYFQVAKLSMCMSCPIGFVNNPADGRCYCPIDKPYIDDKKECRACNGEWDITKMTCKACGTNLIWNINTKTCDCQADNFQDKSGKCTLCPKPAAWDVTNKKCVRCPFGFVFDQKTSECSCPLDKPFLDSNNSCQACSTKWDTTAFKCQVCPFGTQWNKSSQKCEEKCPYALVDGKCQCPQEKPVLDQATQQCTAKPA